MTCSFGMDAEDRRQQTASRRAASLSKDRRRYSEHLRAKDEKKTRASSQKATGWKVVSEHKSSDIATPHRMARSATRSFLAKGMLESGSDMPQLSLDHSTKKPEVSAMLCYAAPEQEQPHELASEQMHEIIAKIEEEGREVLEAQVSAHVRKLENPDLTLPKDLDKELESYAQCLLANSAGMEENAALTAATFDSGAGEENNASPISKVASCSPFDSKLDDDTDFPPLTTGSQKPKQCVTPEFTWKARTQSTLSHVELPDASITPEKSCKNSRPLQKAEEQKSTDELKDWVVLTASDKASNTPRMDTFSSQHPRNIFAIFSRKTAAASAIAQSKAANEAELDIDWSQSGIPTEVKKQIIHGSVNAAHRGPHAKQEQRTVPLNALRAQSRDRSRRQCSVPKSPRSQSKPRSSQQMKGRR